MVTTPTRRRSNSLTRAPYTGDTGGRGLSPALWGGLSAGRFVGVSGDIGFFSDFNTFLGSVSSNVGTYHFDGGSATSYEDTSCTIAQVATESGGVVKLTNVGTDNLECNLQGGGTASVLFDLSDATGERARTTFEARIKLSSVADSIGGAFIGMAEEGSAANSFMADAGGLADKDLIGFFRAEGDGDDIDIVHQKAGGGLITVLANALASDANSPITALTTSYIKLGWQYDFLRQTPQIIYSVNGVLLATTFDLTAGDPPTFPATFPDAEELMWIAAIKQASSTALSMSIDWIACHQEEL